MADGKPAERNEETERASTEKGNGIKEERKIVRFKEYEVAHKYIY